MTLDTKNFGDLKVRHVIHAVGPNYRYFDFDFKKGDELLKGAYENTLKVAEDNGINNIAFSLLSAGIFSGGRGLKKVLEIGLDTILNFNDIKHIKEIFMVGFTPDELTNLTNIIEALEKKYKT